MEILEQEQKKVLETEVAPLVQKARDLAVRSRDDRGIAEALVKKWRDMKVAIEERFHPTANRKKALEVWQMAKDTENAFYEPIDEAIKLVTESVRGFDRSEAIRIERETREAEEKRQAKEREEQAQREAQARAEKEAEEKRQIEEFERLEKERKEKLDLQQRAEAAGNAKVAGIAAKDVAKLDTQIEKVEEEGKQKIAEIEASAEAPAHTAPKFQPPPPAVKKLITKARVTILTLLCKSIAGGEVPFNVITVNEAELNRWAKNQDDTKRIPGIEFYKDVNSRV